MEGCPGHLCFLECHHLLSSFQSSSGLNRNHDPLGLSKLLLTQPLDVSPLLCTHWILLNSRTSRVHWTPVLMGPREHCLQMEAARNGRHILCLSILLLSTLHRSLRFLIQNTSSKTEWLRVSGWRQQSINQAWGPGEDGAPWDCRVHMPEVGPIWRFPSYCGSFQNLRHLAPLSPFGAKSPNLVNKKISTQFPVMFAWQSLLVLSSSSLIIEFPVFNGHKAT